MKTVLITGVSKGLGAALAREHLARGDAVLGLGRSFAADLGDEPRFRFAAVDLEAIETIASAVGAVLRGESCVDLVWLNAAVLGEIRDLAEAPVCELERVMRVNVWANKVVLDAVYLGGSSPRQVVAISSGAAKALARGWSGYAISKLALNGLVQVYARERPATQFLALAPGLIDTAMQDALCGMTPDPRFERLADLRAARGTDKMPPPRLTAQRLIDALPKLESMPSGAFADLRDL